MQLPLARSRARKLVERIEPLVERVEVVGSIRRAREHVGDIELLAEPKTRTEPDLFHPEEVPDLEPVVQALSDVGEVVKSGARYVQVRLGERPPGDFDTRTQLDLFLCHPPAQWGALKVIRTGPADYSRICVTRLRNRGWRQWRGAVWRKADGTAAARGEEPKADVEGAWERVPTPDEPTYFEHCEMRGAPPEKRDEVVARLRDLRKGRRP